VSGVDESAPAKTNAGTGSWRIPPADLPRRVARRARFSYLAGQSASPASASPRRSADRFEIARKGDEVRVHVRN